MVLRFLQRQLAPACALALLCCGCLSNEAPTESEPVQPRSLVELMCKGNLDNQELRDGPVRATIIPGYNPAFYYEHPFKEIVHLQDLNLKNPEIWRDEVLNVAYKTLRPKLLADIKSRPDRWYFDSGLQKALEDESTFASWPPPSGMPIDLIAQRGVINCVAKTYTFTGKIVVARKPLDAMPEVATLIGGGMSRPIEERFRALATKGIVEFDLPGPVFDELRRQVPADRMKEVAQQYSEQLKYVDSETQLLIEWLKGTVKIAPFNTAEYRLGGDMTLVLSVLAQAYQRVAEPSSFYEITVVGRADSRALGGRSYVGGADTSLPPQRRLPFTKREISGTLTNNQQLSVARGYAAAEAVDAELRQRGATNFRLLYGGDGEVSTNQFDKARRLEVTVRKAKNDGQD